MTTIMEIACDKCLRPVTSPSPVNQTQGITTDGLALTICKHLYHQSCIMELYNTSTTVNSKQHRILICEHQNCATPVNHDQIFTIVPTLQSRTIDFVGSASGDEDLKRDFKIAQDTINHLKKMAQQYAFDLKFAHTKIIQLETKLKETNALYRQAIEDKTRKLVSHHSEVNTTPRIAASTVDLPPAFGEYPRGEALNPFATSIPNQLTQNGRQFTTQTGGQFTTNTNVLRAASGMPKCNVKQKNTYTLSLANDESSESQAQSYADAAAQISKLPKSTTKQLPISTVNQMPNTMASQMPKSTPNQNENNNAPTPTTAYEYVPFKIPKIPAKEKNTGKRRGASCGNQLDSSEKELNEIDWFPAMKRAKPGPTDQTARCHKRFQHRYKMDSTVLKPFYPLDSYPHQYTAAGIYYRGTGDPKTAVLAMDVLMIGDGLIYGMVQFILKYKMFKNILHPELYRRDLSITDLARTLKTFPTLPPRIMLSIGNWDVFKSMEMQTFCLNFQKLLRIFRSRRVQELYLMPLIKYTTQDPAAFANVDSLFQVNWENILGGKYMIMNTEPFFENLHPVVDELGPMFKLEQFEPYVEYIREEFIPYPKKKDSASDEAMERTEDIIEV